LLHGPLLPNGIALQQLGMTATRVVGPFIAGALIAFSFSGSAGAYFFMAGMFVIVIITLVRVPGGLAPAAASRGSFGGDFMLGVRHIQERRRLLLLCLGFIGFVVGGFSYQIIIPGFVENELGRGPGAVGLLLGINGVAGLAITIGIAGIADSRHAFSIMLAFGVLAAVGLVFMAVAGGLAISAAAMILIGAGASGYQLLNSALVMQESDPRYFGRVMSITMLAWGFNGLVAYPYGVVADVIGENQTLALMGAIVLAVQVAVALGLVTAPRRAVEQHALVPSGAATTPGGPSAA
jgi:hypothetical protein